jgi:K+-transporting ATPase ATPase C chain
MTSAINRELVAALRPSLVMTGLFAGLLGLAYPAAITGIAQVAFPWAANGSLVTEHGQVIGSDLIGQGFASPRYFHGRPSAAGSAGYDASASAGSNLAPSSRPCTIASPARSRIWPPLHQALPFRLTW